mmetsp:Transcript_10567/g.33281  ORF Transcript_10567/g.33281 Transcript_10567/m.33281 type:complete len:212 (-) Transcript_10567:165-800(-)
MAACRKAALSSKPTLASAAMSVPFASSASGLTSTIVQSHSQNSLKSARICSAAAFLSPVHLRPSTMASASLSDIPFAMSTGTLMMASGLEWARSSIEVPPTAHAITSARGSGRLSRIEKYISRRRSIFLATITTLTGLPAGPDCLVTSVPPSILRAYASTSDVLMMCTPPLNPLVNVPSPRPPARICDLITTSASPIFCAAATASSGVLAG